MGIKCRLIVFITCCCTTVMAQQRDFIFKNLSQEDGLPSNEAYYVYQDSRHYLWFATDKGVVRFDGRTMQQYPLPDNVIFRIYEDSRGRIWFFGYGCRFSYFLNNKVYPYRHNDKIKTHLEGLVIKNARVDAERNDEMVLTCRGLTCRIDKEGTVTKESPLADTLLAVDEFIAVQNGPVIFVKALKLAAAPKQTVIRYTANGKNIVCNIPGKPVKSAGVAAALALSGGGCIFYTNRTLIRINPDGRWVRKEMPGEILTVAEINNHLVAGMKINGMQLLDTGLVLIQPIPALAGLSITSIASDYEGGLWCTSLEKGAFFCKSLNVYKNIHPDIAGIPNYRLYSAGAGSYLAANSKGIFYCTGQTVLPVYRHAFANSITDLFIDRGKLIVAGSEYAVPVTALPAVNLPGQPPLQLFQLTSTSEIARTDSFYRCTASRGYKKIAFTNLQDVYGGLRELPIAGRMVMEDSNNHLWAGSMTGLYRYEEAADRLIVQMPGDVRLINGVNCMRQLPGGILAAGTRFNGILLMRDTAVLANITEADGLLSNSVKYLLPKGNQLWAATAKGITVITFQSTTPARFTIHSIGKNLGFFNLLINQLMPLGQDMLAATSNGIYTISRPGNLLAKELPALPFYISSIQYYRGDTTAVETLQFPYRHNGVTLRLSAICFNTPDEVQYSYRFAETDTSWKTIAATELILQNLAPGTYRLQLMAGLPGGQRHSQIQQLTIVVQKPWWQNNWLRLLTVLMLLLAGYLLFGYRFKIIKRKAAQKAAMRARIAELEQTALRSQMNPHFIFNCLSSIQQLVMSGSNEEANEYLVRFARLIRKTLELSGAPLISLADEKEYLTEYLAMEQLRMPGRFSFTISIDEAINPMRTLIPNMMLQPVVENAVRHGIKPLQHKAGLLRIHFQQQGGVLCCTVTDNGVGRQNSAVSSSNFEGHRSYGTDIIRKRLEVLAAAVQDSSLQLSITDLYNGEGQPDGTAVQLFLPIKTTIK
jgi:hypothetical protein